MLRLRLRPTRTAAPTTVAAAPAAASTATPARRPRHRCTPRHRRAVTIVSTILIIITRLITTNIIMPGSSMATAHRTSHHHCWARPRECQVMGTMCRSITITTTITMVAIVVTPITAAPNRSPLTRTQRLILMVALKLQTEAPPS